MLPTGDTLGPVWGQGAGTCVHYSLLSISWPRPYTDRALGGDSSIRTNLGPAQWRGRGGSPEPMAGRTDLVQSLGQGRHPPKVMFN